MFDNEAEDLRRWSEKIWKLPCSFEEFGVDSNIESTSEVRGRGTGWTSGLGDLAQSRKSDHRTLKNS